MTDKMLLALDPGGTSGAARFLVSDDKPLLLVKAEQWPGGVDGAVAQLLGCAENVDLLVSESFVLDNRTPNPDVTPLRIEGAMRALALQGLLPNPVMQRNTAKAHAPDALLKRVGLWQKGQPHANDAIRHAIAFAKMRGHRPTIEWLWPVPEGV